MPSIRAGWTAAQVRAAEQPLLAAREPLMQRAAAGLAAESERILAARGPHPGAVLVLAGSGNNGGDALFAAAALAGSGHRVTIVPLGRALHEEGLAAARGAGAATAESTDPQAVATLATGSDLLLDGILGTGAAATPALRPPASDVVAAILATRTPATVVAVDLPSGIGPDDGAVYEPVLPAEVTVTFGAIKAGLLLEPARAKAGRIVLVDLGLAPHLHGEPVVAPD